MDIDDRLVALVIAVVLVVALVGAVALTDRGENDNNPNNTIEGAMNTPDQGKAIDIVNDYNQTSNVSIKVVDENNQTVHEGSYTVGPESNKRDVWSISELNRTGISEYSITAEWRNQTQTVDVKTNKCYGDTIVEIQEEGTLYVYYVIC